MSPTRQSRYGDGVTFPVVDCARRDLDASFDVLNDPEALDGPNMRAPLSAYFPCSGPESIRHIRSCLRSTWMNLGVSRRQFCWSPL